MKNILEEIYNHKLTEVRNCKKNLSVQEICKKINCAKYDIKADNFYDALKQKDKNNEIGLIAEIKKASPSAGLIRQNFNAQEIAKIYEENGATCLSVLTDEKYFLGQNKYLEDARKVTNLPILRKDFIVDNYQIYEAKMLGANCILLIIAMLDDKKLIELEKCALDSGLSVLIEIHDESELQRASKLQSKLIGINNRNLKIMKTDINNSVKLVKQIPNDYVVISESGIKTSADIKKLNEVGINCFLIGEHFMKQSDIAAEIKEIFGDKLCLK